MWSLSHTGIVISPDSFSSYATTELHTIHTSRERKSSENSTKNHTYIKLCVNRFFFCWFERERKKSSVCVLYFRNPIAALFACNEIRTFLLVISHLHLDWNLVAEQKKNNWFDWDFIFHEIKFAPVKWNPVRAQKPCTHSPYNKNFVINRRKVCVGVWNSIKWVLSLPVCSLFVLNH